MRPDAGMTGPGARHATRFLTPQEPTTPPMPPTQATTPSEGIDRQYIPPGWTARIVDGDTVFRSPAGDVTTRDVDRVAAAITDYTGAP